MRLAFFGLIIVLVWGCGPEVPSKAEERETILSVEQDGGDTSTQVLALEYRQLDLPARDYLVFRQELSLQDMNGFLAIESDSLARKAARAGLQPTGPPVNLFYGWDVERGWGDAAVAMPVGPDTSLPPYVRITLPASKALMLEMDGGYESLSVMHYSLNEEINRLNVKPLPPSIEEYVVGPADTDNPQEFRTRIYYRYESPDQ